MDDDAFHTAMQVLAVLPSPQTPDAEAIGTRYEVYARLFAGDDPSLFLQACLRGINTKWRFFPSPVEIREQMAAIQDAAERERVRAMYERIVARAEALREQEQADALAAFLNAGTDAPRELPAVEAEPRQRVTRGGEPVHAAGLFSGALVDLDAMRRRRTGGAR